MLLMLVNRRFPLGVYVGRQICDLNMNRLVFLVFWWNGADTVGHFVALLWNVFAFNAKNNEKLFT